MASRVNFATLAGGTRHSLDAPVAALAGLSVAFLAFAAPADLLAELVGSTGLSSIVPAAAPPLGVKARIGLGAVAAVAIFVVAFLLLRWLDRFGTRRTRRDEEPTVDLEPPRLRRRDVHPDAPARAPLLATFDLGEPVEIDEQPPAARRRGLVAGSPPDPEPASESAFPEADEPESILAQPGDAPPPEPTFEPPHADAPRTAEPVLELDAFVPIGPEPAPEASSPPAEGSSITELMARLEQGLARRRTSATPPNPMAPEPTADAADERLQSAIESLQRLASRHQ
jgi:hypothetical protein